MAQNGHTQSTTEADCEHGRETDSGREMGRRSKELERRPTGRRADKQDRELERTQLPPADLQTGRLASSDGCQSALNNGKMAATAARANLNSQAAHQSGLADDQLDCGPRESGGHAEQQRPTGQPRGPLLEGARTSGAQAELSGPKGPSGSAWDAASEHYYSSAGPASCAPAGADKLLPGEPLIRPACWQNRTLIELRHTARQQQQQQVYSNLAISQRSAAAMELASIEQRHYNQLQQDQFEQLQQDQLQQFQQDQIQQNFHQERFLQQNRVLVNRKEPNGNLYCAIHTLGRPAAGRQPCKSDAQLGGAGNSLAPYQIYKSPTLGSFQLQEQQQGVSSARRLPAGLPELPAGVQAVGEGAATLGQRPFLSSSGRHLLSSNSGASTAGHSSLDSGRLDERDNNINNHYSSALAANSKFTFHWAGRPLEPSQTAAPKQPADHCLPPYEAALRAGLHPDQLATLGWPTEQAGGVPGAGSGAAGKLCARELRLRGRRPKDNSHSRAKSAALMCVLVPLAGLLLLLAAFQANLFQPKLVPNGK